ncbi:DUF1569 domain-containing protein [Epilithonimonas ginsengisoli]|uniref:DUF1569 domain-containing protein n=1 Tax=Epilithonimonas ginsengisoli TaxID=1245592 RepID=A0ABU4JLG2_9FLAO|nr:MULTISPECIES: DUF1569 domain-containing protein [Chryseobacterium group]MBV6878505.1 DUF1569 domain-containing protein [Epilithonimonas sp. FP105]MDW8550536.1 DUF1569 domain-containing protein [Epilithonimonas ginsengisoli]OAH71762.1 hypothetical protein AXA65_11630 [Chryseobacterium sp. FP211-J200]
MENITNQLQKIESLLPKIDVTNNQVSKASVGWHLEHCLLILNSSLKGLTMTDPKDYKPKFSVKKFVFLNFGLIPRGKIRAPKQFIPLEVPTQESILKLMSLTKERLEAAKNLPEKSFITHPFLGDFDKKTTLRFLWLHTNHHLKIADDILKK